jgi:2-polyprenyl-3-methyl-5-hydroxy-6-metoxy-1,4-benzoquinol methylase
VPVDADVYRILIASPSDVEAERETARNVILEWNGSHSDDDVYLEPVMYETHVAPDLGTNPQQIIHEQIVESCDLVIGMFWTRIGTATENHPGGAVEEVKQFYDEDSRAIVGFSERDPPRTDIDYEQMQQVDEFKAECQGKGLVFTYESLEEFKHVLTQRLATTMSRLTSAGGDDEIKFERKEEGRESSYDASTDYDRLRKQVDLHIDFDRELVEATLDRISEAGIDPPYRVLDVGCGYGNLTRRLFGDDERFEVLAFDNDEEVIRVAREDFSADNITYRILDVNDIDEADLPASDLVFAAFVLHHVGNPEAVTSLLWDQVADGGAFVCRSVDDGPHLHYPPNEDLEFLIEKDGQVKGSDDRSHGRRMYTHLKRLQPAPVDVGFDFKIHTTAGLNTAEREEYFEVLHSHRIIDVRRMAQSVDATAGDERLYEEMKERLERVRRRFIDNGNVLDVKPVPVAVAYKPPAE